MDRCFLGQGAVGIDSACQSHLKREFCRLHCRYSMTVSVASASPSRGSGLHAGYLLHVLIEYIAAIGNLKFLSVAERHALPDFGDDPAMRGIHKAPDLEIAGHADRNGPGCSSVVGLHLFFGDWHWIMQGVCFNCPCHLR